LRIARLLHLETHIGPNIEHEALMPLRLLDWLGTSACHDPRLELWLAATDRKYADELLAVGEPLVAMATGASHPSRCWPIARFAALAEWLSHEYHASVILLGAPGDPEFSAALNLVGRTTLRQAAALIERCDLFIGNDSGLMHVAAAAKISVVEISGFPRHGSPSHPNSPERFGPWGVPHRILRPPSGTADLCVSAIAVDEVRSACSALLSRRSVRRRPNALDKLLDAR
jgi:heptosyltransferase-2